MSTSKQEKHHQAQCLLLQNHQYHQTMHTYIFSGEIVAGCLQMLWWDATGQGGAGALIEKPYEGGGREEEAPHWM